jgi:hypothetical protein
MRGHAGSAPVAAAPTPRRSGNRILLASPPPRHDDGFDDDGMQDRFAQSDDASESALNSNRKSESPETSADASDERGKKSPRYLPDDAVEDDSLDEGPPWNESRNQPPPAQQANEQPPGAGGKQPGGRRSWTAESA